MDYPGKVITKNQVTPTQISATGVWTLDDAAAATRNNNWPVAGVPNPISKSLRFNSADSAYLNRTFVTPTDNKKWTFSCWIKRSKLSSASTAAGALQFLCTLGGGAQAFFGYGWTDDNDLVFGYGGLARIRTNAVFRDLSAWYHVMLVFDSANATAANRALIYINGVAASLVTINAVGLNDTTLLNSAVNTGIGRQTGQPYVSMDMYLAETYFIDGQALTPSSFGMTDPVTGVWEPLKYSGTYGTNGFYLNFKDATSTTTLGLDYSGNSNTWTTNNFSVTAGSGNDSMTDVPTPWIVYNTTGDVGGVVRGNYATLNPLKIYGANFTYSNGNLQVTDSSSSYVASIPTLTPPNSGKWYWEVTVLSQTTLSTIILGLATEANAYSTSASTMSSYGRYRSDGDITNLAGTAQTAGSSYTTNDVIGVALDVDSGTVRFYKNGVAQGATPSFSFTAGTVLVPYIIGDNTAGTKTLAANFGQRPFAYTPPSGFLSLCTTNLPASTVLKGSEYMNAVLYTGNGSSQSITGVGFQPDFTWIKSRSGADNHNLFNAVVGLPNRLFSNLTNAENTTAGTLTSFNSDGFSVGSISDVNANAVTFVGWNWKANGAGVSNTAGTITSTVSANTTSGFSIVTYTGNGTAGATVGHGLGVAPRMFILKSRSATTNWDVYHASLGNTGGIYLNSTSAFVSNILFWNDTSPTSSVLTLGGASDINTNGQTGVIYCFAAISGFSAFGSYTGNGSADGPFVYLGFRPEFVITKRTDGAGDNWTLHDAARSPYNVASENLRPNTSGAEGSYPMDFLSNGFKWRQGGGDGNESGASYIYMAFAENPFKNALAR